MDFIINGVEIAMTRAFPASAIAINYFAERCLVDVDCKLGFINEKGWCVQSQLLYVAIKICSNQKRKKKSKGMVVVLTQF